MSTATTSHNNTNMSLVIFVGIIIFGVILGTFVLVIPVTMKAIDLFVLVVIAMFITIVPYVASVRFYSPITIDEDGKIFSTFDNSYEIIHDDLLGGSFAMVYAGGYNSDRKYLSGHDITQGTKQTTLLVTPTRLVESMANGRYLIIRGRLDELSPEESASFLLRKSVAAALEDRVKKARVFFVFSSKSIHPDVIPEGVDMQAILKHYQHVSGELRETVRDSIDQFAQKIRFVKDVRGTDTPEKQLAAAIKAKVDAGEQQEEKKWVL